MKTLTVSFDQLVRKALSQIDSVPPIKAIEMARQPDVAVVDVRDIRELQRDGCIPGAYHAPRGLIESWVDPKSEYFKPELGENRTYLICCASGRRSALVTQALVSMGMDNVINMAGGYAAWKLLDGQTCSFEENRHIDLFDAGDQLVEL